MRHDAGLRTTLGLYAALNYPIVLLALSVHLGAVPQSTSHAALFSLATFFVYGAFYTLVVWTVARIAATILKRLMTPARAVVTSLVVAVALFSLLCMALFVDGQIYRMYGFHLNGFVWNLLTTPGGLESMGSSGSALYMVIAFAVAIVLVQTGLAVVARRFVQPHWERFGGRRAFARTAIVSLVAVALVQHGAFGVAFMEHDAPIVLASKAFPLYQPTTFRKLAKKLGYEAPERKAVHVASGETMQLNYPAAPLRVEAPAKPLNIVWLVAESWRWDMLDPQIMPHTAAFAADNVHYRRHYSGGNGTRMGMFSMFFGLYGNYWFPMLAQRRGPALMDVLQQQGYQIEAYTSAKFTYPEFDRTVFSQIPTSALHEDPNGPTWQRDERNVAKLLSSLDRRDPNKPFMRFMFFESPHARYEFPPESAIRKPYLDDLNYATMDLERDIGLIKNRYINACNHLDSQFARVFDYLKREKLLDNTIVIITGDHGEEFMEKGRWGHNSDFTEEQVRVPLVLHVPGVAPAQIDRMTSHLDIPATVMPLLGVRNPASDYSLGDDLLDAKQARKYTVFASWTDLGYRDDAYKATFPRESGNVFDVSIHTGADAPVADADEFYTNRRVEMAEMMRNSVRFSRPRQSEDKVADAPLL